MAEVLGVFDAQAFVVLVVAVIGLVPVLLYRKATPTVLVVPYAFLTVAAFATNFENVILPDVLNFTEHLVGNLGAGVGFAVAAGQLGVDAVFVVPERFSVEKQQLMRALGADVINTPTEDGMGGAIERAHELAEELDDAVVPQQFSNPLNPEAHYETTGPEIGDALDDEVGALVAGCGTAGTLMGTGRYLRDQVPELHVTAVEPKGSLYATTQGEDVEQGEYKTEGIGTHDVSTNELVDPERLDDLKTIPDRAVHEEMARLAREEGQLVASSAAANSLAAIGVAEGIRDGAIEAPHETVVTVFADSSERYLSKGVYRSFEEWTG